MITVALFALTAIAYHEAAHAVAANEYGILNGIILFWAQDGILKRLFLWGVACDVDGELTERERRITTFAPLLWLPVAGVVYGAYLWTGHGVLYSGALVTATAGGLTLVSDLPQWALGLQDLPEVKRIWLWQSDDYSEV